MMVLENVVSPGCKIMAGNVSFWGICLKFQGGVKPHKKRYQILVNSFLFAFSEVGMYSFDYR